jgi:NADPH-dependent curcumin reductase CurA
MHDESEKDVTILQAKIGGDYKTFIKQNSKDYLERLKVELMKGFKVYFDELNTKVNEELINATKIFTRRIRKLPKNQTPILF